MYADMLRAQPRPHQYTLLGFMPLPPRPARPCAVAFFASAGLKYLSPPRVRGNGRRSDHSDDPIPWRITAPAGAWHLSLMMGRWSAPLAHRRLSPPSFLFAFFFFLSFFLPPNTDTIRCARTLFGWPKRKEADSVPALDRPSKWIVSRLGLRDGVWRYDLVSCRGF